MSKKPLSIARQHPTDLLLEARLGDCRDERSPMQRGNRKRLSRIGLTENVPRFKWKVLCENEQEDK